MKFTRSICLLVLLIAIGGIALWASPGVLCAGCNEPTRQSCISEAMGNYQECCWYFGNAGCTTFCLTALESDYHGCMVLNGCPTPPPLYPQ